MATAKKSASTAKTVAAKTTKAACGTKKCAPKKGSPTSSGVDPVFGEDVVLVTRDGLAQLKQEYETLTTTRRKEIAARLKEAIAYGDLSENSEYQEAKEEQAFVEGRINELEKQLKNVRVIEEGDEDSVRVKIGTKVSVKNLTLKTEAVYTIVGSTEADIASGRISNESPVGKALLGKTKGATVKIEIPAGAHEYEVIKIG